MKLFFTRSKCLSRRKLKDYAAAKLPAEERFEVENHLLDCALCQAALDGYLLAAQQEPLSASDYELALLEKEYAKRNPSPLKIQRSKPLVFFVLAILLLSIWAGYKYWKQTSQEQLYAFNFVPATNEYLVFRSEEKRLADPALAAAMHHYDGAHYAAALPYFNTYLSQNPKDEQAMFYAGIANLAMGQIDKAIGLFEELIDVDAAHALPAHWYLALAHLRNYDNAAARSELQFLLAIESPYREKAAALLDRLK